MKDISYAIGLSMASNLRSSGVENLDIEEFALGMRAIFEDAPIRFTPEETNQMLDRYFGELKEKTQSQQSALGKSFLEENAKRPGVMQTASGLQYKVLEEGSGPKPGKHNRVKVHYTGTLIDGTVFDSSVSRGQPAVFGVTQVISGWVEGLQLMNSGAKYRFFIPSDLAYGKQGAGQHIKPDSTLIFDVELLEVL